ncbi:MAG: hypothetical protein AB7O98_04270 [Hyphomonadaceae bacterium]
MWWAIGVGGLAAFAASAWVLGRATARPLDRNELPAVTFARGGCFTLVFAGAALILAAAVWRVWSMTGR